jgi:hypothetical protein
MGSALFHREPDELFSTRRSPLVCAVSIIDLEGGHQPLRMRMERFGLFAMERSIISKELRNELEKKRHPNTGVRAKRIGELDYQPHRRWFIQAVSRHV